MFAFIPGNPGQENRREFAPVKGAGKKCREFAPVKGKGAGDGEKVPGICTAGGKRPSHR